MFRCKPFSNKERKIFIEWSKDFKHKGVLSESEKWEYHARKIKSNSYFTANDIFKLASEIASKLVVIEDLKELCNGKFFNSEIEAETLEVASKLLQIDLPHDNSVEVNNLSYALGLLKIKVMEM